MPKREEIHQNKDKYQAKEDYFDKEFMKSIGFEVIKDNGQYGEAHSIIPKGKIIINFNRDYAYDYLTRNPVPESNFVGIKEDGGTRIVFSGFITSKEDLKFILSKTC